MFAGIQPKAGQKVVGILRRNGTQQAHGGHVFGLRQSRAQSNGTVVHPIVVLRRPGRATGFRAAQGQRSIVDLGGRRKAFIQGRRIDKWLDGRARLAPGLCHMVEGAGVEVKAAHQGAVGTGLVIQRYERRPNVG